MNAAKETETPERRARLGSAASRGGGGSRGEVEDYEDLFLGGLRWHWHDNDTITQGAVKKMLSAK